MCLYFIFGVLTLFLWKQQANAEDEISLITLLNALPKLKTS